MKNLKLIFFICVVLLFDITGIFVRISGSEAPDTNVCLDCHVSEMVKPELRTIPGDWKKSWHYQNNISCHDCHGGDPKDAAMAMDPQRGFVGKPEYSKIPEFCGKCHIGILKHYLESGHGKALKTMRTGPNCVTCHGSHGIQKAGMDIINEERCSQCHTYERAKAMKDALSLTEKRIREIEEGLKKLRHKGVFTEEHDKMLFSTHAEFRTLFHSVDVSLIKDRTGEFLKKLEQIGAAIQETFRELGFRRNFSIFLVALFIGMSVVLLMMSKDNK